MKRTNKRIHYRPSPITHRSTVDILEFFLVSPPDIDIQDFNNTLADIIRKEPDARNRTTDVKAHMTKWNLTNDYPEMKFVTDQIMEVITDHWVNVSSLDPILHLATCWGGIYKKGDYADPHSHLPGFYSFVYYINAEEGASPIVFTDANTPINPVSGYGIIFPSWLVHEVPEHQSDKERIFISGNIEATGSISYPQRKWMET